MLLFKSARLKLTTWYVAIIMVVSLSFSFFVYRNVIGELNRGLRIRSLRTSFVTDQFLASDQKLYEDVHQRIISQLTLVNILILVMSASAGYFLAGKTLHPIELVMEDQRRFIGDASHELRTPLTSLKTEIEVSLRDRKLNLAQARELLKSNLEEVNKMQQLSSYLLSLSKYEEKDKLVKVNVSLLKVCQKVIERFNTVAARKNIKIISKLSNITVFGEERSLEELIGILVDNAIKYGKEDGKVKLRLKATKGKAIIEVEDNGVGIKASDIPYIFNRFYRADASRTKEKIEGYGLGLSIARSIVEAHKGEIKVKSTLGKGTSFKVLIPR